MERSGAPVLPFSLFGQKQAKNRPIFPAQGLTEYKTDGTLNS
jgi:hypothetical protein